MERIKRQDKANLRTNRPRYASRRMDSRSRTRSKPQRTGNGPEHVHVLPLVLVCVYVSYLPARNAAALPMVRSQRYRSTSRPRTVLLQIEEPLRVEVSHVLYSGRRGWTAEAVPGRPERLDTRQPRCHRCAAHGTCCMTRRAILLRQDSRSRSNGMRGSARSRSRGRGNPQPAQLGIVLAR